jgi:hypothetical protein
MPPPARDNHDERLARIDMILEELRLNTARDYSAESHPAVQHGRCWWRKGPPERFSPVATAQTVRVGLEEQRLII